MDAQLENQFSTSQFIALLLLATSLSVQASASEPDQKNPETVYVAVEQARLYAGPSTDFYPTGDAKRGTALEVYHRTQSGWLGVRPPQGSFSWVPASQAYMLPGGRVIEITDASSVSWIGTELGSAKQYRWQVQLKVGEQLTVLGEATIKNDTDDREALWYKVSPPAGEFRWIENAAISKTAPPVIPTGPIASPNESQVTSKSVEPDTAGNQAKPSEASNVANKENQAEKEVVRTASYEGPSGPRDLKKLTANSRKSNPLAKHRPPQDQWEGWYAFEMSEQGLRTPFLDKLSGRDPGQSSLSPKAPSAQRDPLINDPFSLTMTEEPQKPLPSELNAAVKKQRDWRDPRSLRAARLSGSQQSSVGALAARLESDSIPSNVQVASSNDSQSQTNQVNTAGYNLNEIKKESALPTDVNAGVNWYGLSADTSLDGNSPTISPNTTAPGSGLNLVTRAVDVDELQLALNDTVASTNGPWNLAPLAERARYLIEHGPNAIDRGQARLLLERIEAFQNVSARTQQINAGPFPSNAIQSSSYNASTQNRSLPNSASVTSNYEATGWLVPVLAGGPDQPTHALTNDTGDIVAYVSPIAGLNLDRYRNQPVGVNGLRGYLPQLKAAHIQVQRVSRVR